MKIRHVFLAENLAAAKQSVDAARRLGLADGDISLITQPDVELERIPENLKDDDASDFAPAAVRGALGGGTVGLLAGLIGAAIPPLGITLVGAAFLGVAGAAVGTWSSALMGSAIPSEVHRKFEHHIREGEALVVIDAEAARMAEVEAAFASTGVHKVDFEAPTALS